MKMTVRSTGSSSGFTLVEVLVAVMIISVVIASLLQLYGNNTRFFQNFEAKVGTPMYLTLMMDTEDVDSGKRRLHLDNLVKPFEVDDELRRRLKMMSATADYQPLKQLDSDTINDVAETMEAEGVDGSVTQTEQPSLIEIGRLTLSINGDSTSVLRVRSE